MIFVFICYYIWVQFYTTFSSITLFAILCCRLYFFHATYVDRPTDQLFLDYVFLFSCFLILFLLALTYRKLGFSTISTTRL